MESPGEREPQPTPPPAPLRAPPSTPPPPSNPPSPPQIHHPSPRSHRLSKSWRPSLAAQATRSFWTGVTRALSTFTPKLVPEKMQSTRGQAPAKLAPIEVPGGSAPAASGSGSSATNLRSASPEGVFGASPQTTKSLTAVIRFVASPATGWGTSPAPAHRAIHTPSPTSFDPASPSHLRASIAISSLPHSVPDSAFHQKTSTAE